MLSLKSSSPPLDMMCSSDPSSPPSDMIFSPPSGSSDCPSPPSSQCSLPSDMFYCSGSSSPPSESSSPQSARSPKLGKRPCTRSSPSQHDPAKKSKVTILPKMPDTRSSLSQHDPATKPKKRIIIPDLPDTGKLRPIIPGQADMTEDEFFKALDKLYPMEGAPYTPEKYDPNRVLPKGYMWVNGFFRNSEPDRVVPMRCAVCAKSGDHLAENCPKKNSPEAMLPSHLKFYSL